MINSYTIDDLFDAQEFSFKKIFSREAIDSFCSLTQDYHPLHTDDIYAKKHGFDGVILQGFLVSSFISYVVGMRIPGENALILAQESKHSKPIYANEEVTYICKVCKIDRRFSTFILHYEVYNGKGYKAVSGSVKVKVRKPK